LRALAGALLATLNSLRTVDIDVRGEEEITCLFYFFANGSGAALWSLRIALSNRAHENVALAMFVENLRGGKVLQSEDLFVEIV
jgi:hypothetical protein